MWGQFMARLAAADDFVNEAPPCWEIVKVARGAQQQRVGERSLEMAVGALDRAVLVADAGICGSASCRNGRRTLRSASSNHPWQSALRLRKAAERLSLRCCPGTPPGAHWAFCSPSACATKLSPPSTTWVFEARERQAEVIKSAIEDLASDGDAEIDHLGGSINFSVTFVAIPYALLK
jgi:hypothetical protein